MVTVLDYNNKKNYIFAGDLKDSILKPLGFKGNADPNNGFSDELYDYYINRRDYANAAKYSSMFSYKDIREELKHKAWIRDTEEIAKQRNAIFNSVADENERQLLEFSSSVFDKDAFSSLDIRNPFIQRYNKIFNQIGTDTDSRPTRLSVTFSQDKSKFLGLWDVENDNSYSKFLENAKYSEEYLSSKGVSISPVDGKTTISFDVNTDVGRKLLYNLGKFSTNNGIIGDKELEIQGYDAQGNKTNNPFTQVKTSYSDIGDTFNTKSIYLLKELADVVDSAKVKEKEIQDRTLKRVYTTNLYGSESADIQRLERLIGNTPDSETRNMYKDDLKNLQEDVKNQIVGIGLTQHNVVSNLSNDEGDETMRNVSSTDKENLKHYITQAWNDGKLSYQLAESNGKFGCYITIPATIKKGWMNLEGKEQKTINVFIEGLLADKAKQAVAADTQYAAIHELDQMEAWGYGYDLSDGRKIIVNRSGDDDEVTTFSVLDKDGNESTYSKSDLVKIINADKIKKDGALELYKKYVNTNGEIIDKAALDTDMKKLATYIANGSYPDEEPITDFEAAFNMSSDDKLNISFGMFDKISAMEEAYREILTQFQLLQ